MSGGKISTQKRVEIALTYIHGIGRTMASSICREVGIPQARRVNELTDDEVARIRETIDRDYVVEGDLRRNVAMNIKRLMRSEEHTSELQSLMRISYAVFCLKKKKKKIVDTDNTQNT